MSWEHNLMIDWDLCPYDVYLRILQSYKREVPIQQRRQVVIALSDGHLAGASIGQQELYDALLAHQSEESDVISAYEAFAENTSSEAVRYLICMVLDDEKRHHRVLSDLANAVRADATFDRQGTRVPLLDVRHRDQSLLEATDRFIAIERKDRAELKRLARKVRRVGGEFDAFMIGILQADTQRHIRILRFIRQSVRNSPFALRTAP